MSAAGSNSTCMDSTPLVQLRMDANDPYNGMESDFEDPEVPIEEIQLGIWHRESDEDLRSMNETPHLHTRYQIEVDGRRVYTRAVYKVFKELLVESTLGIVKEVVKDVIYEVNIERHPFIHNWVPEKHTVEVDMPSETFTCSCKGFEFEGLLCSHAMKVMQHVGFTCLPAKYILKRWTKEANSNVKRPICERITEDGETVQLMEYRFDSLKADLCRIAKIGSKSASMFAKMKSRLADLEVEFFDMAAALTSEEAPLQQGEATNSPPNKIPKFFDPVDSQCKGRKKKPTRFLPPAEANVKKRRTCSFCNQQAGHNARTCPNRGNISSKEKKVESEEEDDDIEEELSD